MNTLKLWLKNIRERASSRLDRWIGDNEAKRLIAESGHKPIADYSKK